jgi:hypothetical protein
MTVHRVLSIVLAAVLSAAVGGEICSATTINIAPLGTPQASGSALNVFALNDQASTSQTDALVNGNGREWTAVTFGQLRTFNNLLIEQCPGFVVAGYEVQVAKTGLVSPNPVTDADWERVAGGSFTGQSSGSQPSRSYQFATPYNRAGVRLRTTDSSNIFDSRQRPREFWVFDNYGRNWAKSATITAPGWTGTSQLADDRTTNQEFTTSLSTSPDITFTWGNAIPIEAIMIHGGSGAPNEHLIDFGVQYWNGASWVDFVAPITGNTLKTVYLTPTSTVSTTMLRLHITAADSGNSARVAEVWIFPEPGSASLVLGAMAGAAMMRRRRRVSTFPKD